METLNKKTLSFSTRFFTRAAAALAIVTSVAACGNNGGGGGGGVPGSFVGANCASCVSTMGNPRAIDIFNARNATGIANLQNMQLFVSDANFVPGTSSSYNLYSGPVAIQGTFTLNQTAADPATGQCVIPAGSYAIQTAQVGQMSSGVLRIPLLVSTTANIVMELRDGALYKDAATQSTRLFGTLLIKSVNGQNCTAAFSDLLN